MDHKDKKDVNSKVKTAVALSYNLEDEAPKIVASGKGFLADKILDAANVNQIPVHQDDKLANTLSKLELGDYIPPELYQVVAEVLLFVDQVDDIKSKLAKVK